MSKTILVISVVVLMGAIAAGGYYLKLHVQDYQVAQANERMKAAEYEQDNVKGYLQSCEGIKPKNIVTIFDCITKQQKESRETKTSHYDLKAQQEMAVWAYIIVWLTAGGVIVGVLGFVALVVDIRVARKMGQVQSKAYFLFHPEKLTFNRSPVGNGITIVSKLTNVGQTPAKAVFAGMWIGNEPVELNIPPKNVKMDKIKSYIAPGGALDQFLLTIPFENFVFEESGVKEVWVCIFISWTDAFDDKCSAAFRYKMVKDGVALRAKEIETQALQGEINFSGS